MRSTSRIKSHRLPICGATGLRRYRDRHQARHGVAALSKPDCAAKLVSFACPACRGFHLNALSQPRLESVGPPIAGIGAAGASRRYVLVDIENLLAGHGTRGDARALWRALVQDTPGITANDHVVIGGNRYVAKKFSTTIIGANVKWVVGADSPDGADRALLGAISVHHVAKHYDELVIMSGDHAFAELAQRARRVGVPVHVVTTKRTDGTSSLSRELIAAADLTTTVAFERAGNRAFGVGPTLAA